MKLWTVSDMKLAQEQDPDIRPVLDAKTGCMCCKLTWEEICSESPAAKAYWAEWDALYVQNGCLYRRWESNDGTRVKL